MMLSKSNKGANLVINFIEAVAEIPQIASFKVSTWSSLGLRWSLTPAPAFPQFFAIFVEIGHLERFRELHTILVPSNGRTAAGTLVGRYPGPLNIDQQIRFRCCDTFLQTGTRCRNFCSITQKIARMTLRNWMLSLIGKNIGIRRGVWIGGRGSQFIPTVITFNLLCLYII